MDHLLSGNIDLLFANAMTIWGKHFYFCHTGVFIPSLLDYSLNQALCVIFNNDEKMIEIQIIKIIL